MAPSKGNKHAVGNKGGVGGPLKYKPEFATQAKMAARANFTDVEIAELFGVNECTIHEWKKTHQEFSQALEEGKRIFDNGEVVNALLKRALGFKRVVERLHEGETVECKEEVPPETSAIKFWLMNRESKLWKERQEVKHEGGIDVVFKTPIASNNQSNDQDSD